MIPDAPRAAKRPWPYPLPPEAIDFFVHPGGEPDLEHARRMPDDTVVAANGYLALIVETFLPGDFPPADDSFAARIAKLPWHRIPDDSHPAWRDLADAVPALFRYGPRPIWERSVRRYHLRAAPTVRLGAGAVAPLALIQLCSRLPRARVLTDNRLGDPVLIRWNRGTAIIPHLDRIDPPKFSILAPKTDPLTKRQYF